MKPEYMAIATAILFGAGSIGLKLFLNGGELLILAAAALAGAAGVIIFQFALRRGNSYLANAIVTGGAAAAAALGGFLLLGEQLTQVEMLGIAVILIGVAVASRS
jgi:multidrug transporter EmrE-like cation transporter